jgi:glycolate oxidase FAD binding subunit
VRVPALDLPACSIDEFGPLPVATPSTVAEVGSLVQQASAKQQALYPMGGRTMLSLGMPPTGPGIAVDLRLLDRVIDYPARDMTITVQAGITLAKLQELLRTEHQRLPVDVPLADQATLGGALAANVSGPRRYGFGTFRDYVIGISAINDEGHEFKAGGRVVKNVAGYDLCKLLVGSLGTLGVITQVTLKLRPMPEEQAIVLLGCDDDALPGLLDRLHGSRTRPVCLDLLNARAASSMTTVHAAWLIAVGFEDNREAVTWQLQQLVQEVSRNGTISQDARVGPAADSVWRTLIEFPLRSDSRLTFKANMLPSSVATFCRNANALPEAPLLQAHAGSGIVIGHVDAALTVEQARAMLEKLQTWTGAGRVMVLHCPADWKAHLPIWGTPRPDWWLMRTIKEKFDPRRVFNPGRFVDGI